MVIMMGSLLEFSSGTLDLLPMVWVHMNALVVESMDNGLYHGKQLITL